MARQITGPSNTEENKQKNLGVLFAGNLDKLNPYGKTYRSRFVVLTNDNFHWFKVLH
jgi:ABC-type sugar transport system substrate-binding protein